MEAKYYMTAGLVHLPSLWVPCQSHSLARAKDEAEKFYHRSVNSGAMKIAKAVGRDPLMLEIKAWLTLSPYYHGYNWRHKGGDIGHIVEALTIPEA